jgi:Questin oxidase-like
VFPVKNTLLNFTDGDPLIQLALALEISSKTLAIESLGRACCEHNPVFLKVSNQSNKDDKKDIGTILSQISEDHEVDGKHQSIEDVLAKQGSRLAAYALQWNLEAASFEAEFVEAQLRAILLAAELDDASKPSPIQFGSTVRSSYALRTLLPLQPNSETQENLARQWLLLFLAAFVLAGAPASPTMRDWKTGFSAKNITWKKIDESCLLDAKNLASKGQFGVVRAIQETAKTWPAYEEFCLWAAARYLRLV